MKNIYEIKKATEEVLLSRAKQTIEKYAVLKEIYNDTFLSKLVQHKKDYNNLLLFWLVNDNPIDSLTTPNFLQDIENDIKLFQFDTNFDILKLKLRQWKTIPFESAVTELEFAAQYLRKGYKIELEPILPNNKKGDFCATKESTKIYFEVKMLFEESSIQNDAITIDLSARCDEIEHPFILNIDLKRSFRRSHCAEFAKYLKKKLEKIQTISDGFPLSLLYPENGNPTVAVEVLGRVPSGENGFTAGFTYGGGIKMSWTDVRRKIVSGVSQLHPAHPGVIVARPYGLATFDYDIQNALFGDLGVIFSRYEKAQAIRSGDRIFGKKKNSRLSAVIYYDKRLQAKGYVKKQIVYHNPFAAKRIAPEVFDGENVTQV